MESVRPASGHYGLVFITLLAGDALGSGVARLSRLNLLNGYHNWLVPAPFWCTFQLLDPAPSSLLTLVEEGPPLLRSDSRPATCCPPP
jgi:hypothetical protein